MLGGAELGREGGGGDVAGDEVGLGVGEETWYDGERVPKVCVTAGVRRDTSSVKVLASKAVARLPLMGFFGV